MSLTNPFAGADAWDVSTDSLLPIGNHLVTIVEAEQATAKSSQNPQAHLRLENPTGTIQDWVPYSADFLGKIVSVFDAAGITRPGEGEFDPDDNFRLTDACLRRLLNQKVGIVIREEPDLEGKPRRRVQGYVTPDRVGGSGTTNGGGQATTPAAQTTSVGTADDDIPF